MTSDEAKLSAAAELQERHLVRITQRIHDRHFADVGIGFHMLMLDIRTIFKTCESNAIDDVDLIEEIIDSLFSPHPSRFKPRDQEYLNSVLRNAESSPQGRATAIRRFVESRT